MYHNLVHELKKKNITNKVVAELIGISEKTFYNKVSGATEFTLTEAMSINDNLLPEFKLGYLFTRTA